MDKTSTTIFTSTPIAMALFLLLLLWEYFFPPITELLIFSKLFVIPYAVSVNLYLLLNYSQTYPQELTFPQGHVKNFKEAQGTYLKKILLLHLSKSCKLLAMHLMR